MIHQRSTPKALLLLTSLVAFAGLAACGDDDESTEPGSGGTAGEEDPETTASTADDSAGPDDAAGDDGSLTVGGVTYSFSPSLCLPDGTAGSSVSGSGSAEDGTAVYVDMAGGTLSVYLGTDDPFAGDPDYVASSVAGQGELNETVDGSTVTAEASFAEHGATDVVADGFLEVTC